MNKKIFIFQIIIIVTILFLATTWFFMMDNITIKYDCRMLIGGWHPDIPVIVQDECRIRKYI